ncbi:MAG TPA: galactokinase [Verrucomicrobiae bacterium]|nr:galactokinase [Verrucomicrobiae bacterium]
MTNLQQLSADTAQQFLKIYGRPPRWLVAAPGRVNVIGEHTDYNEGYVLPMAIERYAVMAADRAADGKNIIQIRDTSDVEPTLIDLSAPITPALPKWGNYPRGVVAGCLARGMNPGGLDVLLNSTVPLGSGLSSSAALEVCAATLVEAVTGKKIDPVEKAMLCQKAEHEFANVPCGIMDQFVSIMGRQNQLLLIDCRSLKTQLVPMSDASVAVLIINTNVKHDLSSGGYASQRARCETAAKILGVPALRDLTPETLEQAKGKLDEAMFRCARHAVGEIQRTEQAAQEIKNSNWDAAGRLLYASHRSLRDDYQVSCKELDTVVEIAESIGIKGGVYGCRMTGAGFGGCAVALVKTEMVEAISKQIAADYKKKTKIAPTIFVSRPAAGATILKA